LVDYGRKKRAKSSFRALVLFLPPYPSLLRLSKKMLLKIMNWREGRHVKRVERQLFEQIEKASY
jgi:hypothetical protein